MSWYMILNGIAIVTAAGLQTPLEVFLGYGAATMLVGIWACYRDIAA